MPRRKARVDANQSPIAEHLRQCNLHVTLLHTVGAGVPDLLVTGYHRGLDRVVSAFVEVKTATGKLTPDQVEWHANFPEDGPLIVARESSDVLRWFEII